jgi:hypothetical protein
MKIHLCCLSAALLFSSTLAFAQMEKPAMSSGTKPMEMDMDAKKAKSKACSDQADAKKLHGKEREKFRAKCKKEM